MTEADQPLPAEVHFLATQAALRSTNLAIAEAMQAMRSLALANLAEASDRPQEMIEHHQKAVDELKQAGDYLAKSNNLLDRLIHEG